MTADKPFNILMYSHDTYGLGHIRRSMAIASHLANPESNVLILTGSPVAGRFSFPPQVDFVRIPGMIKQKDGDYQSLSIRIDQEQALAIRTGLILSAAQSFKPDIFIVDKEPHGLKREVLPTLQWLKEHSPQTTTILGLRDILDEAAIIQADWKDRGIYDTLDQLYDEVWVYGMQKLYDAVEQYRIPQEIGDKLVYTGYLPRTNLSKKVRNKVRRKYRIASDETFVLVTAGGGGDGGEMIECFLDMHEQFPESVPFKSMVVTGPFMAKEQREAIRKRARQFDIKMLPFHPNMEELMKASDLVLSMGGYNTMCELLTQQVPALIIPREVPRLEQLIRAQCFAEHRLFDYLPWNRMTPQSLREKIFALLSSRDQYVQTMEAFPLSGFDVIKERIQLITRSKR